MINVTEIRKGMVIIFNGELQQVIDFMHITPGNWRAINQVKMKNLKTGKVIEQRMNSSDKVEPAQLEEKTMEFLFSEASGFTFMDTATYDQYTIPMDIIGDDAKYYTSNIQVRIYYYDNKVVSVVLPNTVELTVTATSPNIKSATVTNVYKSATLETGLIVQVPPFILTGEKVKVDTRSGEYLERAK